jgi:uncharacterized damage-inducible protein DinB
MNMEEWVSFLDYLDKVHARTVRVARCIPADRLEEPHAAGKFSLGDLVRHIAGINRYMFAETACQRPNRYPGNHRKIAEGLPNILAYFEHCHEQTMTMLRELTPDQINSKCATPDGASITVWKWLRLMAEHEIHHRGQIYFYLSQLGVATPPLYGLTSEEVLARSVKEPT